jgi:hypothetical protein
MTPLTDEQIDAVLEQQRPHLRACYRAMFEKGQPWVGVKVGSMPLPNGAQWDLMVLYCLEPVAKIIEGALSGHQRYNEAMAKAATPVQAPAAQPGNAKGNAFGL